MRLADTSATLLKHVPMIINGKVSELLL
jgi:hypothetical protein